MSMSVLATPFVPSAAEHVLRDDPKQDDDDIRNSLEIVGYVMNQGPCASTGCGKFARSVVSKDDEPTQELCGGCLTKLEQEKGYKAETSSCIIS